MGKQWLFDRAWTKNFTELRMSFIAELIGQVRQQAGLASALDVGCGVGDISKYLSDFGLKVHGVDGREENAAEARRRFPEIDFQVANAEDLPVGSMGVFDLVLCFGLLYHLENPFRAIRNLQAVTGKLLLIESMCLPGQNATMELLNESRGEDQGLNYVAFYPSEASLTKMLYRAGFPYVYRFSQLPADELYTQTVWRKKMRTLLAASKIPISAPNLVLASEPIRHVGKDADPWTTNLSRSRDFLTTNLFRMRMLVSRLTRPLRRGITKNGSDSPH